MFGAAPAQCVGRNVLDSPGLLRRKRSVTGISNTRRGLLVGALCALAPAANAQAVFVTPRPSGPHQVGRVERGIGGRTALIHYPAIGEIGATARGAAMPDAHLDNLTRRFGAGAAQALWSGAGFAQPGASVRAGRYPAVLFAPGMRLAAHDYRALLEDVASHGYVVVALSPDVADPRPIADQLIAARAVVQTWASDGDDRLGAIVDAARIGVTGHSIGGAASVLAASTEPGFACAANLDGDYIGAAGAARPRQAVFHLASSDAHEPNRSRERRARTWRDVSARSVSATLVRMPEAAHFNMLDAALLQAQMPADKRSGRFGAIEPAQGLALTGALLCAFLRERLNGEGDALLAAARLAERVTIVQAPR